MTIRFCSSRISGNLIAEIVAKLFRYTHIFVDLKGVFIVLLSWLPTWFFLAVEHLKRYAHSDYSELTTHRYLHAKSNFRLLHRITYDIPSPLQTYAKQIGLIKPSYRRSRPEFFECTSTGVKWPDGGDGLRTLEVCYGRTSTPALDPGVDPPVLLGRAAAQTKVKTPPGRIKFQTRAVWSIPMWKVATDRLLAFVLYLGDAKGWCGS